MHPLMAGIFITFYGPDGSLDVPKTLLVNGIIFAGIAGLILVVRAVATHANRTKAAETHRQLGFEPTADGSGRGERSVRAPEDF